MTEKTEIEVFKEVFARCYPNHKQVERNYYNYKSLVIEYFYLEYSSISGSYYEPLEIDYDPKTGKIKDMNRG